MTFTYASFLLSESLEQDKIGGNQKRRIFWINNCTCLLICPPYLGSICEMMMRGSEKYLIPRYAATIILYCLVSVLWLSKSTTRINLLLPSSGIVDDVLDNKGTLKFSTRMCWPRVQSDPFWPSVLHIFHWYKKQFSKDKRPSGSVKIIRRQTIQHTWYMTESFIIHERAI